MHGLLPSDGQHGARALVSLCVVQAVLLQRMGITLAENNWVIHDFVTPWTFQTLYTRWPFTVLADKDMELAGRQVRTAVSQNSPAELLGMDLHIINWIVGTLLCLAFFVFLCCLKKCFCDKYPSLTPSSTSPPSPTLRHRWRSGSGSTPATVGSRGRMSAPQTPASARPFDAAAGQFSQLKQQCAAAPPSYDEALHM